MTAQGLAARIFAGFVVAVLVVGGAILAISDKADTAATTGKANREIIVTNRARIATNEHKDDATRRCLTVAKRPQACVERVVGAQGPGGTTGPGGRVGMRGLNGLRGRTGKPGRTGSTGRAGRDAPALTAEGVAEGFAVWCRRMLCVGANGEPGKDAPPVTRAELMAALTELCGGSCNGRDAPPPTQDQVNAACAAGLCPASTGPPGPQGATGEQGPQGPPAPPAPCDESLGYVCQPPAAPPPPP
jgi:hypothetical protein